MPRVLPCRCAQAVTRRAPAATYSMRPGPYLLDSLFALPLDWPRRLPGARLGVTLPDALRRLPGASQLLPYSMRPGGYPACPERYPAQLVRAPRPTLGDPTQISTYYGSTPAWKHVPPPRNPRTVAYPAHLMPGT